MYDCCKWVECCSDRIYAVDALYMIFFKYKNFIMANIILRAEGDKNGEECKSIREINCEKVSKKVLYKKLNSQKKN